MMVFNSCVVQWRLLIQSIAPWLLMLILLSGCQRSDTSNYVYRIEQWQGSVDPRLPPGVQDKQDAIIRLFTAIQDVGIENVADEQPDILFKEEFDAFFEDTADFFRWEWNGPPEQDIFPVLLTLRKDEPGLPEVSKHRKYRVRNSGGKFLITRVAIQD